MSLHFNRVRPGDLITADMFNSVLSALEDLDSRVGTGSSGGTKLSISSIVPPPPLRVLQAIQINGNNFGMSRGGTVLKFGTRQVNTFNLGSNDSVLFVNVPVIDNVPPAGIDVPLFISNGQTDDTVLVRILPADQPQGGNVDIALNSLVAPNPNPNPIVSGQQALIAYTLTSRATLPATVTIGIQSSDSTVQSTAQVLSDNQAVLADRRINVGPSEQKGFFVLIPSIPGASNTSFSLTVSASGAGISGSFMQSFTVGQTSATPDPTINLAFTRLTCFNPASGAPDATAGTFTAADNTLHIRSTFIGRVVLAASFTQIGTYNVSVDLTSGNNWAAVLADTPSSYVIEQIDLTTGSGTAQRSPEIGFQASAGASASGQITFTVQRVGATQKQTRMFNLAIQP